MGFAMGQNSGKCNGFTNASGLAYAGGKFVFFLFTGLLVLFYDEVFFSVSQ